MTVLGDFSFSGRLRRGQFWGRWILIWVGEILLISPALVVWFTADTDYVPSWSIYWVILLLVVGNIYWVSVLVRRWHDRGKSAWWVLIWLIPYIGSAWTFIELGFLKGDPGPNRYGEPSP